MTDERYELINDTLATLSADNWLSVISTCYLTDTRLFLTIDDPPEVRLQVLDDATCIWC